jgi:hypothetical protein
MFCLYNQRTEVAQLNATLKKYTPNSTTQVSGKWKD